MCVVAISDSNVGIDIEFIKPHRSKIDRLLTEKDIEYISSSAEKDQSFYKIWTGKEAYAKALGTGLSTPLNSFEIVDTYSENLKHFNLLGNYVVSIYCSAESEFENPVEIRI